MRLVDYLKVHRRRWGSLDSRLRRWVKGERQGVSRVLPSQYFEPAFCLSCGRAGGYVTKETPIIYQCESCAARYGDLPLPKVPDVLADSVRIHP